MSKIGILICGHGSRDPGAIREFNAMVEVLRPRLDGYDLASGFLEFAHPTLAEGLDTLRIGGVTEILAVPAMLFAAAHVKNDIPSVLNAYEAKHPGITIRFGRELGLDPKLLRAAASRVEDAITDAGDHIPRHKTLLMIAGRGSSDPDANANVSKAARLLWEGLGLGWGQSCYSGVTFPLVEPALEHAVRLRFPRIIVLPWFLFTGVLVQRVRQYVAQAAERHPRVEFVNAQYLGRHPLTADAFVDRIHGILHGDTAMNCKLCKYREQTTGFEDQVGLPQTSGHHHAEAGGSSGHHHHPYPHAAHPMGPASMKRT